MKKILVIAALLATPVWSVLPEVVDGAGMFSPAAVEQANSKIRDLQSRTKKQMVVETVTSLGGRRVEDVAREHARDRQVNGLLVLISKQERKIATEVGSKTQKVFSSSDASDLRTRITSRFKTNDYDGGLQSAVDFYVERVGSSAHASAGSSSGTASDTSRASSDTSSASSSGSGIWGWIKGMGIVGIICTLLSLFIVYRIVKGILKAVFGMFRPAQPQQMPTQQPGMSPGTYQPGYSPGPMGGGGGGMGFMGSLMTGMLGAAAGSYVYDKFTGGGSSYAHGSSGDMTSPSSSSDDGSNYSSGSSGWDSDSGSSSSDSGSSDWGGGGDSGGGDSGGGGDW